MSEQVPDLSAQQQKPFVLRGSLVRTVVIALMVFSIIPAIIIGGISYIRFRNSIQTQTQTQLSSISQTYSYQADQMVAEQQSVADEVVNSALMRTYITSLLNGSGDKNYNLALYSLNKLLTDTVDTASDVGVRQFDVVDGLGNVLLSSESTRIGKPFSGTDFVKSLNGSTQTVMTYNPNEALAEKIALVTTQTYTAGSEETKLTLFEYASPSLLQTLLTNPQSIFSYAHVFYITTDGQIVSINPVMQSPAVVEITPEFKATLTKLVAESNYGQNYTYVNASNNEVFSFIKKMNSFNGTYVFEVPTSSVFSQLQPLLSFMLILLAATLLVVGLIAFFATRQMVNPLVDLSNKARRYANGDFSQKASVTRSDEIGLLANSFNNMVEQLTTFYQNLETRVATRTEGLRTSLEIGQQAVASATHNEIFQKTVEQITEKLGYTYASIYSIDATGKSMRLVADSSKVSEGLPERNLLLPVDNASLVGWVARNNETRLSQDITNERPKMKPESRLASAHSDFAIPILLNGKPTAVLNIQTEAVNGFDVESIPSFLIITRQIEAGLQNIALLESTQTNYQETILLYQATREIIQARSKEELYLSFTNLFRQTDLAAFLLDVTQEDVKIVKIGDAQSTPLDDAILGTAIPFAKALTKLTSEGTEITTNFQYLTDFSNLNAHFGRRGCSSNAVIPIFEGKELTHLLAIGARSEDPLTAAQVQPYINLAGSIGAAIERIQYMERLDTDAQRFELLKNIAEIATRKESENTFAAIHEKINTIIGEGFGLAIAINDSEHSQIEIPYFFDDELIEVEKYDYSSDLLTNIIRSRQSVMIADAILSGQRIIESATFQRTARSVVGVPLFNGPQVLGAFIVFDLNNANRFDQASLTMVELVGSQIAAVINEEQLLQKLTVTRANLDRQQFLLTSILENLPSRVAVKDQNNQFVTVSRAFAQYVGYNQEKDLLGKPDTFSYSTESPETSATTDAEVLATQRPILKVQEQWQKPTGDVEWVMTSKMPLNSPDGSLHGLLSIYEDVTGMVTAENLARRRADQLLTASEIARESSSGAMDIGDTLARSVELIKERFGFYHASIFLIDPLGKFAVLRESTGDAGAQLKARAHKLAVGSASIVGQATGKGEPVVIGDVTKEANYYANPLLPETRSELAIPMKIGDAILGALDVQSTKYNAFSLDDINILQVLADQVAVAVQNAELFTNTIETLSRHRLLHRITDVNVQANTVEDAIRAAIETLHSSLPDERVAYLSNVDNSALLVQASAGYPSSDIGASKYQFGQGLIGKAAQTRKPVMVPEVQADPAFYPISVDSNSVMAIPVSFSDRLIGVINVESTQIAHFDDNDVDFVTTLANNLASIISNIELVDQVRSQVERQQKLFEITDKIRRSVDIETIMKTSVTEIASAMNIRKASIEINPRFQGEAQKEQE
ncbi:MAG: GAF domain-containing protein [Anaerolineaceae bacterium]|nr:GAF domain-containing protein [Anaerolineaceae bacterium]